MRKKAVNQVYGVLKAVCELEKRAESSAGLSRHRQP